MKRPRTVWLFAALAVVCTAGLTLGAAQQYTFSIAGNVPGSYQTTPVAASLTHFVGYDSLPASPDQGYIQTGSQFITPAPKSAKSSYLSGINGLGVAVGGYCGVPCSGLNAQHGYTYDFNTAKITTFTVPFSGQ